MNRTVAFLPWLRLESDVACGPFTFIPWREERRNQRPRLDRRLRGAGVSLQRILGAYRDVESHSVSNCVVVINPAANPPWDLTGVDQEKLRWHALCLFAASAAAYDFSDVGTYVNSTDFTLVVQRFTEPASSIAICARRRDGRVLIGGYEHQKVRVSMPPQCHAPRPVSPDTQLLEALLAEENSALGPKLATALPYFSLAWSDMDAMLERTELLLAASTIEQLIGPVGDRVDFGKKVAKLLQPWQRVTVKTARTTRTGIKLDPQKAKADGSLKGPTPAEQEKWFVHRKWAEDLYAARNAAVHHGARTNDGWSTLEHLVAAAIIFLLLLKLKLVPSGVYQLSDRDKMWLAALDRILALPRWWDDRGRPQFAELLNRARWDVLNGGADAFIRAALAKKTHAKKC
jgi:hypothetical protein